MTEVEIFVSVKSFSSFLHEPTTMSLVSLSLFFWYSISLLFRDPFLLSYAFHKPRSSIVDSSLCALFGSESYIMPNLWFYCMHVFSLLHYNRNWIVSSNSWNQFSVWNICHLNLVTEMKPLLAYLHDHTTMIWSNSSTVAIDLCWFIMCYLTCLLWD